MRVLCILGFLAVSACGGTTIAAGGGSTTVVGAGGGGAATGGGGSTNFTSPISGGGVPALPSGVAPPTTGNDANFENLLNNVRIANGVGTVSYNANLNTAAQAHAEDMVARGYFDHVSPEGDGPGDRATAAGYSWSLLAENIAPDLPDEASALAGWNGSPAHFANNINPTVEDFGLGVAGTGSDVRWVLLLGKER